MTLHPRLYLLPRGQGERADALDGERGDRVGKSRRGFEIVPVREGEGETGAEGVARAGRIYHFIRRKAPDLDFPPAA